jgi:magnesium-transporting ATPase (P-type)
VLAIGACLGIEAQGVRVCVNLGVSLVPALEELRHAVRVVSLPSTVAYHEACHTAEGTPLSQDTIRDEIWNRPIFAILESLGTTAAGLSRAEVETRRQQCGFNQPLAHRRRPLWLQFLARFLNPLVLILLFASGLSAATGNVASSLSDLTENGSRIEIMFHFGDIPCSYVIFFQPIFIQNCPKLLSPTGC